MSSRPPWNIVVSPRAERELLRLPARDQARVRLALDRLAISSERIDIQKLAGSRREWRLRVGNLRIRFAYDRVKRTIVVMRVVPRGRAYRD